MSAPRSRAAARPKRACIRCLPTAIRRRRPDAHEQNHLARSMPRRIVDISVSLKAGIASDPSYMLPSITYLDHKAGADSFMQVFGVRREQLPDGAGPAMEQVAISTHNGTHLDAPYHFHPTM